MSRASVAKRLLSYAQHKVHPHVRAWSDEATIITNLQEELGGDLERLYGDTLAAQFAYHCPVAGAKPDNYKNRLLEVAGLELLTGIRFRGLDMTQPFVDVIYGSKVVWNPEELGAIKDALRTEYAVFQPKRLRFYQASHLPPLPGEGDKRLIAAPLWVMLEQPVRSAHIELRGANALEFYPEYAAIYAQLHTAQPELVPVTRAKSEDDLQGYLEAGTLFEIWVNDIWAGICAVFADVRLGIGGFCMGEIILAPAFRGQGFGSAFQRLLAEELLANGAASTAFLFGTIGEVNVPARRAAARAGRLDLGGQVWVNL